MFRRNVRQRGLVTLHIGKLAPLFISKIQQQHSQVVSCHPKQPFLVVTHFPYNYLVRYTGKAASPHQVSQIRVPMLFLWHVDIGSHRVCNDPYQSVLIHINPVIVIGVQALLDKIVFPKHFSVCSVDTHQFAQG